MDLIIREAVIDKLNAIPSGNWSKVRYTRELWDVPSVPAVPLDELCDWLAGNAYLKDDTEGAWELNPDNWKKLLTKWMEEQDADRQ